MTGKDEPRRNPMLYKTKIRMEDDYLIEGLANITNINGVADILSDEHPFFQVDMLRANGTKYKLVVNSNKMLYMIMDESQ
jgi:hypothetical protein